VKLIAVSKRMPSSAIREAYGAGQRDFGENYIQELLEKRQELADLPDLVFHLIGNIQSNKAKAAARLADVVHTIDDEGIARELGKRVATMDRRLPVLLEVNVAREPKKHGALPESVMSLCETTRAQLSLELIGLMTVPPFTEDPEGARPHFAALRALRDRLGLAELSMGMTHDMDVAIEEGATMVRVGTAIFGARA
jgi:pyridoxal phosphate enzyme (YggS family)